MMKSKNYTGIIPAQYLGKEIEAESSIDLKDKNAAILFYEGLKKRLLDVNNWHNVAGIISAKFHVTDYSGKN